MPTAMWMRTAAASALCAVGVIVPAATLLAVGQRPAHLSGAVHIWGVGLGAVIATAAAVALTLAGAKRGDARTVLVGTGFSAMAALLALHGIATPGYLVGWNGLISFTGGATLPVGAAVLALTALPALQRPGSVRLLLVLQALLLATITSLGVLGILVPSIVPSVPEPASPAAILVLVVGLALFVFLAVRAVNTFLLTRRRSDLVVVVGLALLGSALVASLLLSFHELGWWLGHGFELLGIVLVGVTVAVDLRRGSPSRSLAGGPEAGELVAAEEVFLGARVRALTLRLAEKDEYTEEHTRRVALRAVQVGEELGLAPSRLRMLATGGLLHDIGKLSIPDAILKKPGALEKDEFEVIKLHPELGHRLLGELGGFPDAVRRLVLDHHERLDGSGYPNGRSAPELDLETRILAVCDVYDALISVRVYRDAWTHERAVSLLREQTGSQFDAGCVHALERVLEREAADSLGVAV
ncbi:MAG TPA: HD-GYP domain-containing protein [Gaiellaceae bacterium]|nr:HD-GYP domain-containing protein [Gaiellaceae bacterium]